MNRTASTAAINRTGIQTALTRGNDLLNSIKDAKPSSDGDEQLISLERNAYAEHGSTVGHPPPAPVGEPVGGAMQAGKMESIGVLVDKLGERLAFERSGVRLYDALLAKLETHGEVPGGPSRADLVEIRDDEQRHFELVKNVIVELGGDPTVVTPSADLSAVKSMGLPQVLTDPRTTLAQCLEAILVAELVDNECWNVLITLAERSGYRKVAEAFRKALASEEEHLSMVRGWVEMMTVRPESPPS